jgi:hypothetical protein
MPACTASTKRLKAKSKLGLGDKSVRIDKLAQSRLFELGVF